MSAQRQLGPITRPAELATWIMMGNNQKAKSAVIVEGESDTSVFLFIADMSACRLFVAKGKDNVLATVQIIRKAQYPGVLAIVDADFWNLEGKSPNLADVYKTDTHDLETMILGTVAYQKVLLRHDFCPVGTVEVGMDQFQSRAAELMTAVQAVALRIGYLRWTAIRKGLRIRFSEISLRRCLDSNSLRLNDERLEAEILRSSDAGAGSWSQIKEEADKLQNEQHDPWQVCRGHDITEVLALRLSRSRPNPLTRREIEKDLSAAYDSSEFRKTLLFQQLRGWEVRNKPRRILRDT
jgi:hypothetical protein